MTKRIVLAALATLAFGVPGLAQDPPGWAFGAGVFEVADDNLRAFEAGIEYRWRPFELWGLDLKPTAGFSATEEGNYWAYGGARWDLPVDSARWIPTVGFAVTLYEDGDGKYLGGPLQFRSSFEIAYRLDSGARIGLILYHLSNAGLDSDNPGEESLLLTYSFGR